MEPRLNVVTLVVRDLERARHFYLQGLGWSVAFDSPGALTMVQVGEKLILSLWDEQAARHEIGRVERGALPFTLAHNVASEAEVDAVLACARKAGATVYEPRKRAWGGYSGYFLDPEGFRWEVAFNPAPIGRVKLP